MSMLLIVSTLGLVAVIAVLVANRISTRGFLERQLNRWHKYRAERKHLKELQDIFKRH